MLGCRRNRYPKLSPLRFSSEIIIVKHKAFATIWMQIFLVKVKQFMQKNLATGSVFQNIISFSVPYLFSYFLQTLYGMADLYITGQYYGSDVITAVSVGSQVMHMITVIIVGLTMGTTVNIGQAIGAQKKEDTSKIIGNTTSLFMLVSLIFTAVCLLLTNGIVSVMSTPVESIAETRIYLQTCFIGIPFITAYNVLSSIFRGMGDSKSPMYFISVACVVNIILDYVFIGFFQMGAMGAALGTIVSQTVSVIFAFVSVLRKKMGISLHKGDFILSRIIVGKILQVGFPRSFQHAFNSVRARRPKQWCRSS